MVASTTQSPMVAPPSHLDGARVLCYAISQHGGFYYVGNAAQEQVPVSAVAICRYDGSDVVYLFKCTADWDVMHDADCASVDEAMARAAQQATSETPEWITASAD